MSSLQSQKIHTKHSNNETYSENFIENYRVHVYYLHFSILTYKQFLIGTLRHITGTKEPNQDFVLF